MTNPTTELSDIESQSISLDILKELKKDRVNNNKIIFDEEYTYADHLEKVSPQYKKNLESTIDKIQIIGKQEEGFISFEMRILF